jgi:hypothetical protein
MYKPVRLHSKFHKKSPELYRGENKLRRILKTKNKRNTKQAGTYGFGVQVTATVKSGENLCKVLFISTATSTFLDIVDCF